MELIHTLRRAATYHGQFLDRDELLVKMGKMFPDVALEVLIRATHFGRARLLRRQAANVAAYASLRIPLSNYTSPITRRECSDCGGSIVLAEVRRAIRGRCKPRCPVCLEESS